MNCQEAESEFVAREKEVRFVCWEATRRLPALRSSLTSPVLVRPEIVLRRQPPGELQSLTVAVSAVTAKPPSSQTPQTGQAWPDRVVMAPQLSEVSPEVTSHTLALRSSEPERRKLPSILTQRTRETWPCSRWLTMMEPSDRSLMTVRLQSSPQLTTRLSVMASLETGPVCVMISDLQSRVLRL